MIDKSQSKQTYFLLISKFSEGLGIYLDCDFALIKFDVDIQTDSNEEDKEVDQNVKEI